MANPGEMHGGMPFGGDARGWRMLYLDPTLMAREVEEEIVGEVEIVHPVARDQFLAGHFARLFECLTASRPDRLARDENLLLCVVHMLRQHGKERFPSSGRTPCFAKSFQILDSATESSVPLSELAALT